MKKYTYEEVKEYIESFGYILLSTEYKSVKDKLLVQCCKHHKPYLVTFDKFKNRNQRCPECANEHRGEYCKLTYEYVKEYIESFEYKLLSEEYKNNNTKIKIQCNKKHEPYMVTFGSFKKGTRCPYCEKERRGETRKLTYEYIKEYLESFNYKLLSDEYKKNEKIKIKCPNNHEYEVKWNKFQQGQRCPICNISKGEQRIIDWLDKNNIIYIYDKEYFKDLLSPLGNYLRPDFIIEDKKIWIEYDGEFHYKKMYEKQDFETLQIHDKLKDEYAKENGWKLIRIPYWDFDKIEEILDKEIF